MSLSGDDLKAKENIVSNDNSETKLNIDDDDDAECKLSIANDDDSENKQNSTSNDDDFENKRNSTSIDDDFEAETNMSVKEEEECSENGSTFSAVDNLCSVCNKFFRRKDYLKKHVRLKHPECYQTKERPYKCECGHSYKTVKILKCHQKKIHNMTDTKIYECKRCNIRFTKKLRLTRHNIEVHPSEYQKKNKSHITCHYDSCDKQFFHRKPLINHIMADHQIDLKAEKQTFHHWDDFLAWKELEEKSSFSYFTKPHGAYVIKGKKVHFYMCQQNGSSRAHRKSTEPARISDRRNRKGSIKKDITCTASMKVIEDKNHFVVEYVQKHNHEINKSDEAHRRIPQKVWNIISEKLHQDTPVEEIINFLISNNLVSSKRSLRKKIVEYKRKRSIRSKILDRSFPRSVLIRKLKVYENEPVILNKPLGIKIEVGDEGVEELSEMPISNEEELFDDGPKEDGLSTDEILENKVLSEIHTNMMGILSFLENPNVKKLLLHKINENVRNTLLECKAAEEGITCYKIA